MKQCVVYWWVEYELLPGVCEGLRWKGYHLGWRKVFNCSHATCEARELSGTILTVKLVSLSIDVHILEIDVALATLRFFDFVDLDENDILW